MEFRKILEVIRRRKWFVIQGFLIITLTAIIGSALVTPVYETSAKVLVKSSSSASSLLNSIGLEDFSSLLEGSEDDLDTYIALATVSPILQTVIWKLQLRDDSGALMKPKALRTETLLSAIFPRPYVEVSDIEDTDILEIKANSTDPEEAAMIANTLAETFIDDSLMRTREEYRSAKDFIDDRIGLAKMNYLKALKAIKNFKLKHKTVDLGKETEVAIKKISELMKEKEDNIIDIAEAKAKIATLKRQFSSKKNMPVSSSAISENPQIENLTKKLTDLQLQLAGALTEKRPEHPEIKALKKRIQQAREELKIQMDIFAKSSMGLEALQRDLAALEAHLIGVNADIRKYISLLKTIPEKSFDQAQLELKLLVNQKLYSSLLEYTYEVGVAEAMTLSELKLVERADVPEIDNPKRPNKLLNGIIGIILGLICGLGLAFLVDYVADTVKHPDDIRGLSMTFLGSIPRFKRKGPVLISDKDPKDYLSESYRTVRNSLKFLALDRPVNSVMVTSCVENEGKTTTLANLGISMCREKKRVILVDADLRRPKLHEVIGIYENNLGLSTVISGEATAEEATVATDIEGLNLIPSGPVPPDPGSIVESVQMGELIKLLGREYDMVLIDTPPVLVSTDALIIGRHTDVTLLVMESDRINKRAISQTLQRFGNANLYPAGAILNKCKVSRSDYHSYQYYRYKRSGR